MSMGPSYGTSLRGRDDALMRVTPKSTSPIPTEIRTRLSMGMEPTPVDGVVAANTPLVGLGLGLAGGPAVPLKYAAMVMVALPPW